MTEEPKTEEVKPAPAAEPAKTEPTEPVKAHPPGYEPVDLDALGLDPEKAAPIKQRFDYLYKNVKLGEAERRQLREHNDGLQKALETLESRIAPLETAKSQDDEVRIAAAIKQARDTGDVDTEVRLLKMLNKAEKPPEKKPEPAQAINWTEALTPWASEVDQNGTLTRPWLQADHPEHDLAQGRAMSLVREWQSRGTPITGNTLPTFLQQLDAKMKPTNGARTQAVLSTSQTRGPTPKGVELTTEEKWHADKMMTHIQDQTERYKRYAAQKSARRRAGQ